MGGFIKFHDVENRAQTGSIPQAKYDMVYTDSHYLGQVRRAGPARRSRRYQLFKPGVSNLQCSADYG